MKRINMNKKIIRLTESDLNRIINESVDAVLKEGFLDSLRRGIQEPEVVEKPKPRVHIFSADELQWMYDNQYGLNKTQIQILNAAMWVRARRANYHGYAKEWPNIVFKDGKTYYYEKYGELRRTGT